MVNNKIKSINNYIINSEPMATIPSPLTILPSGVKCIISEPLEIFVHDKVKYSRCILKSIYTTKFISGTLHRHVGFVNIHDIKRPSIAFIADRLNTILKNEYPNNYIVVSGRYLFDFRRLTLSEVNALIEQIKESSGTEIDFTWLAPLQDIYFNYLIQKTKKAKARPNRVGLVKKNNSIPQHDYDPYADDVFNTNSKTADPLLYTLSGSPQVKKKTTTTAQDSAIYTALSPMVGGGAKSEDNFNTDLKLAAQLLSTDIVKNSEKLELKAIEIANYYGKANLSGVLKAIGDMEKVYRTNKKDYINGNPPSPALTKSKLDHLITLLYKGGIDKKPTPVPDGKGLTYAADYALGTTATSYVIINDILGSGITISPQQWADAQASMESPAPPTSVKPTWNEEEPQEEHEETDY